MTFDANEEFQMHGLIACSASDQPAAVTNCGRVGHGGHKACPFGCSGGTFASSALIPSLHELAPAIIPKGESCLQVPGGSSVTWHRHLASEASAEETSMQEPPDVDEVLGWLEQVEHPNLTRSDRDAIG